MSVSRLVVLLFLAVASQCQAQLGSSLYVVSNAKAAVGKGTSGQVQYQTTRVPEIVETLVAQKGGALSADHATVVFVGCKLAMHTNGPVLTAKAALANMVSKAASSAVYVNAEQAASAEALKVDLERSFHRSGIQYETIGCGGADKQVAEATQSTLLVCSSCEDEVEQLQQLQQLLAEREYTLVYAPAPDAAANAAAVTRKRRLHGSAAPADFSCDAACQTQVKWLQGVLAAMLMALAVFSGLGCLYFLETPTKFEAPKEQ